MQLEDSEMKNISIYFVVILFFASCSKSKETVSSSCMKLDSVRGFHIEKYEKSYLDNSVKIIKAKYPDSFELPMKRYCKFYKVDTESICIRYVIDDVPPGGDVLACHSISDMRLLSIRHGE